MLGYKCEQIGYIIERERFWFMCTKFYEKLILEQNVTKMSLLVKYSSIMDI